MVAENLAGISTPLSTPFSARMRRQWNRTAVTAATIEMESAIGQGGGKQIGWDVEFSGACAASFAEGSDIGVIQSATNPSLPAVLQFGMYRSACQLSNL